MAKKNNPNQMLGAVAGMITLIHQITEDKRIPEKVRKEYLEKFNNIVDGSK
ncbi:hypothetical protein [Oceanobacillus profundus]|uniref:hypothetical protein n=1 Tax=Oceanobacillus profundus TaxID=372463 RepID=UPI0013147885|nr:hypothetical protein [Oceanobacillus profundus]